MAFGVFNKNMLGDTIYAKRLNKSSQLEYKCKRKRNTQ